MEQDGAKKCSINKVTPEIIKLFMSGNVETN